MASFSALFASLTTRVYKYYVLINLTSRNLAASHLELGLTGFILLNLDHYTIYPKLQKNTGSILSSCRGDEFTNVLNFLGLHRPLVLNYDGFHKIPFSVDIEPAALTICKY